MLQKFLYNFLGLTQYFLSVSQTDHFATTVPFYLSFYWLNHTTLCALNLKPFPENLPFNHQKLATDYTSPAVTRTNPDAHAVRGALSSRTNTTEHRPFDNNYYGPVKSEVCALKFHQNTKEFLKPWKKIIPLSLAQMKVSIKREIIL